MKNYKNAFLIVGMPQSGKTTALDVCKEFGNIFCFDRNEHWEVDELIQNIEDDVPATKNVAIEGVRSLDEVQPFIESSLFQSVTVIAVVANASVREERFTEGDESYKYTFAMRDAHATIDGVKTAIQCCDVYLQNNWTTKERFRKKVEQTIEDLLNENKVWV